ncbi:hypothetical protein KRR39_15850 [Nocardioides panacis]|uniref:Glycerophosphoryl diester phosphodiesterase membrane domain-containing protein n=1 Tax=Nocardioides panacis TaxID=2849501 RepID=A0A975SX92_9ACTN|nr:hypothetical protein [Nocardioides panacis]QWZ06978.1 hypothetical protein KRR39_15850 [Nocardioides panacis]
MHKPGVVALRPLALGDFFDGAFKTIRLNPRAMVGLAALVTSVFMAVPVLLSLALAALGELSTGGPSSGLGGVGSAAVLVTYLGSFFGLFAAVVLNGMLVQVVAEAVLGRRTTIGAAWAATRGRMWRLVGLMATTFVLALVLFGVPVAVGVGVGLRAGVGPGVLVGVPLLLAGLVLYLFVQVRYFLLAAPALVLERTGVFASLGRAGRLSRGQFWRLFGTMLLAALLVGVVSQVVSVPLGLVGAVGPLLFPGTTGALMLVLSSFVTQVVVGALTAPFTSAVTALQYVDQRIRKEGLDVQLIAASQGTR